MFTEICVETIGVVAQNPALRHPSGVRRIVRVADIINTTTFTYSFKMKYEIDTYFGFASKFFMKYKDTWKLIELISERDRIYLTFSRILRALLDSIECNCHSESSTG